MLAAVGYPDEHSQAHGASFLPAATWPVMPAVDSDQSERSTLVAGAGSLLQRPKGWRWTAVLAVPPGGAVQPVQELALRVPVLPLLLGYGNGVG